MRILLRKQIRNHVLHARVREILAIGGLNSRCEEKLHFENSLRCLHVLAGDSAADGRFVHTHHFGDLHHCERLQKCHALIHEFPLPLHNLACNVQDRLLALLDALDQKLSGPNFLADVIAHLGRTVRLRH